MEKTRTITRAALDAKCKEVLGISIDKFIEQKFNLPPSGVKRKVQLKAHLWKVTWTIYRVAPTREKAIEFAKENAELKDWGNGWEAHESSKGR